MCDVTRHNFEVYAPVLQELARMSSFVSIDTEFTALCLGKENRPRYSVSPIQLLLNRYTHYTVLYFSLS